MSLSELLATLVPYKQPRHVIAVLIGHAAARLSGFPGPELGGSELVTFHRAQYTDRHGATTGVLDAIRMAIPDEGLLHHVVYDEGQFVSIYAVDWMRDVSEWPGLINEAMEMVPKGSRIIFTAVNFQRASKAWRSSAVLGGKIDACHQFLRTMALKYRAALVYTVGNSDADIDWLSVIAHITNDTSNLPLVERLPPDEQLVADPLFASYGGDKSTDTKQKILALEPSFDFDGAFEGKIQLESLKDPVEMPEPRNLSLAQVLAEFDQSAQSSRGPEEPVPESHKLFYDGVGVGLSEDRKVIREFFSKIAQRSS